MSRILFVRVSAVTYDEKDVPRTWPMLYAAVWPDKDTEGVDSPARLARKLVPAADRGVLELANAFIEHVRFSEISSILKKMLQSQADKLEGLRRELDEALGNRDAQKASALCTAIEDAMDGLENALRDNA